MENSLFSFVSKCVEIDNCVGYDQYGNYTINSLGFWGSPQDQNKTLLYILDVKEQGELLILSNYRKYHLVYSEIQNLENFNNSLFTLTFIPYQEEKRGDWDIIILNKEFGANNFSWLHGS